MTKYSLSQPRQRVCLKIQMLYIRDLDPEKYFIFYYYIMTKKRYFVTSKDFKFSVYLQLLFDRDKDVLKVKSIKFSHKS